MNKNTFSLALLLSTVSASSGNVELGFHFGSSWIRSSSPVQRHFSKNDETTKLELDREWKAGGAGRLSLGYVEPMKNGFFAGVHTFFGWGNGKGDMRCETVIVEGKKDVNKLHGENSFSIKQSLNTGLYGQIGKEYENHRFFGIVGWTLSQFYVSSNLALSSNNKQANDNLKKIAMDNGTHFGGSKSQWRNGLSLGAGYAFQVSPTVQIGLTYVSTWFPGNFTTPVTLSTVVKEKVQKIEKGGLGATELDKIGDHTTSTRSLWNHAIYLSVSMALNKSDA